MGQSTSVFNPDGTYRVYHHPYGLIQRVTQFPWKFYIKNSRVFRLHMITMAIYMPIAFNLCIAEAKMEPTKTYMKDREHYDVTWFDPPKNVIQEKIVE